MLRLQYILLLGSHFRRLPPCVVQAYQGRVLNIHPALLPLFGGKGMFGENVHKAVLQSNCKESGCTVHLVDEEYDTGSILVQHKVPVLENDTPAALAARVLEAEHIALLEAVNLICQKLASTGESSHREETAV